MSGNFFQSWENREITGHVFLNREFLNFKKCLYIFFNVEELFRDFTINSKTKKITPICFAHINFNENDFTLLKI